jgi:1-acyl-sn-glycerol-3-phosphate acyltransferase
MKESHNAYMRACNDLDNGISIAIFPEATIPDCNPQIGRFKNGAFKLAIEKQVPVIPVSFLTNWKRLPDLPHKIFGGSPGMSNITMHPPISTNGLTDDDLENLKAKYRETIEKSFRDFQ